MSGTTRGHFWNSVHLSRTFSGLVWILFRYMDIDLYIIFIWTISVGFSAILLWFCTNLGVYVQFFICFVRFLRGFVQLDIIWKPPASKIAYDVLFPH